VALALLTESFAVRALLGSLTAAALAALAVRAGLTASVRARRLLLLAPLLAAAAAAVATALTSAAYLPRLLLLPATGELGDLVTSTFEQQQPLNLLFVAYGVIAAVLLVRRFLGLLATRRIVGRGRPATTGDARVVDALARIAEGMGLATPKLVLVPRCPGGAFAAGVLHPLVAADPALVAALDDGELDGLLAHELAHLRRRDPLLSLAVGGFRDLTFFLPTVSLAARWLRREQEESADELAALATGRPAALASGILKVWQRAVPGSAAVACPAVPGRARPAVALSTGQQLVAFRVERLIVQRPRPSRRRCRAELTLAAAVLSVGLVAALTVPEWIVERTDADQIWVPFQTSTRPQSVAESPAFATFRSLTDAPPSARHEAPTAASGVEDAACPCVETQAQLREAVGASAPIGRPRLRWSGMEHDYDVPDVRVREVLSLEQGPRVGVFLVEEGQRHP
jgi:beta-lactamase regulating signal transducer with metallopeptidase domain